MAFAAPAPVGFGTNVKLTAAPSGVGCSTVSAPAAARRLSSSKRKSVWLASSFMASRSGPVNHDSSRGAAAASDSMIFWAISPSSIATVVVSEKIRSRAAAPGTTAAALAEEAMVAGLSLAAATDRSLDPLGIRSPIRASSDH
jgi:hypothetical protein